MNIFVGSGALHYQFSQPGENAKQRDSNNLSVRGVAEGRLFDTAGYEIEMYRLDVALLGASKDAEIIREGKLDYYENYYTIGTGEHGVTVYPYTKITYKNIYPNIDWVLYVNSKAKNQTGIKYDFVVHPGANPADIRLKYNGATELELNADGSLKATTPQGTITEQAPVSYEIEGRTIDSRFILKGDVLSFEVGEYNGTLVIDPALDWGTYFGGSDAEHGKSITTDNFGNLYMLGETGSTSNIATNGAYQILHGGKLDVYIVKFNSAGSRLWASYYGGSDWDYGESIATDMQGSVYCTGSTFSTNNIHTTGAYQTSNGGGMDAFIVKFDNTGIRDWATYYGSIGDEDGACIATDSIGNVYISGMTNSSAGIATNGSHQAAYNGNSDAYLVKFNNTGVRQWGTYYGGTLFDGARSMTTDDSCNIYMVGVTMSTSSIATNGTHQTSHGGGSAYDVFIVKIDSSGVRQWGTYYGGSKEDFVGGITIDTTGHLYITGYTYSNNAIATNGVHQPALYFSSGITEDAFLAKFDNHGTRIWGTYYGGNGRDHGNDVEIDSQGDVYITGYTVSTNNISTSGAHQQTNNGGYDCFLAKFDNAGLRKWGTYYGGADYDISAEIELDAVAGIYITGTSYSDTNIATNGVHQSVLSGQIDAFLAKFCDTAPRLKTITGGNTVCKGALITLHNSYPGGTWLSTNGISTVSGLGNLTGISEGVDTIMYIATNACGVDTAWHEITVLPLPTINTQPIDQAVTQNTSAQISIGATGTGLSYQWQEESGGGFQNLINGGQYSGVNSTVLTIANTTGANHNIKYRCIVMEGSCADTSDAATLYVWSLDVERISEHRYSIFPNPVQNTITISAKGTIEKVELFNMLGQKLITQTGESATMQINVSTLPSGMYTIRINDNYFTKLSKQ